MPINSVKTKVKSLVQDRFAKNRSKRLQRAGNNHLLADITYVDKKGNVTTRQVEPYKLTPEDFWGYDVNKGSIRRFKINGIQKVTPLKQTFDPRWEISMDKVAMYRDKINKEAAVKFEKMIYKLTPKAMKVMKEHGISANDLEAEMRRQMKKTAAEKEIPEIRNALRTEMERNIATMMATSHEYKKPAVDEALALVKNYKWEKSTAKITDLQGINKPTDLKKVREMADSIKKGNVKPLITVDKLHGIKPQSAGKRILLDGHHRLKALEYLGKKEVPIYKGTFTGKAQASKEELRERS